MKNLAKAVIFDCDGVLVDSEIIVITEKIKALKEIDLDYTIDDFRNRFIGLDEDEFYKNITMDFNEKFQKTLPNFVRKKIDEKIIKRFHDESYEIEGISQVLESLTHRKCVASSNNAEILRVKLEKSNLYGHFHPHIFSREMVMRGKPSPDLFLFAAQRLGVEPKECVVVEDSINGIIAAKNAGMLPIGFIGGKHLTIDYGCELKKAGAAEVFDSASKLKRFFSQYPNLAT